MIESNKVHKKKDDSIFGILKDDKKDVKNKIKDLRKARSFIKIELYK
ncbi:hypothetical protein ACNSOS_07830 [Aliarcobacter vitoriensis]